jgi:hypothetical protein
MTDPTAAQAREALKKLALVFPADYAYEHGLIATLTAYIERAERAEADAERGEREFSSLLSLACRYTPRDKVNALDLSWTMHQIAMRDGNRISAAAAIDAAALPMEGKR